MKHLFTLLLFAFVSGSILGQNKTIKVSVYFDSDKFELRPEGKKTLDLSLDSLDQIEIIKINITGHTDNSADSVYNLNLSNDRTEKVKDYLIAKGIDGAIIRTSHFGEIKPIANNLLDEGKQKNRRVDVVFTYKPKIILFEVNKEPIPITKVVADTCGKDTVIILPQGTQVVFNRCEYLEIKNCLEFNETNNPNDILANGISLMDTSGYPIASCGMLRVTLKPGCTDRECFKFPIKVRFPVPELKECDYCSKNARVWNLSNSGGWVQEQDKKKNVKIINVEGRLFYQLSIACPNYWKNCDCRLPRGRKIKFKTKGRYEIVNVKVTSSCPTAVIEFKPKSRKNVVKKRIPCLLNDKTVIATVIDKNGDTLQLKQMPLNDLTKRTVFSRCKKIKGENIGRRNGIFPIHKRSFYRKYIIKPSNLQSQPKKPN